MLRGTLKNDPHNRPTLLMNRSPHTSPSSDMDISFIEGKTESRRMIRTRIQPLNNLLAMAPPTATAIFRKQVSFEPNETTIPSNSLSEEELKACWYSKRELAIGCREAKQTVALINSVNGDWNAIDHSKICIVGLEKFHGKKERDANKKLLIKSVLIRQQINKNLGLIQETNGLKDISTMISASFKEYARWQAAMHMVHAHGGKPQVPPPIPAMQSNNKRLRIEVPQKAEIAQTTNTRTMVNHTPKDLMQTLEECTNSSKRIRTCR